METGALTIEGDSYPLDFRIYLPPCYDELDSQFYPTLYLIHGQNFTDDQWDRLGVDETMDALTATDEIPPFIIVMPRDYKWDPPDVDPFADGVVQVLVPYIDQNYRTIPDRAFRAVGGLSRGAGWALHIGFGNWQDFSSVGMHSLAVLWGDVPDIKRWLDAIPLESMPRIYMDVGNKDFPEIIEPTLWFEDLLNQRGIAHEFYLFSGEHVESYWQAHIEQYVRWYAASW
jgi:enterochelin esterase-like enzyme